MLGTRLRPPRPPQAGRGAADAARARGSAAFQRGDFAAAERLYTLALRLTPRAPLALLAADSSPSATALLWSNRSAARASRGDFQGALEDAERCLRAAPRWAKAFGRKGAALVGLGQGGEAVKAYAAGLTLEPASESLRAGLDGARDAIRSAQARYTEMWGTREAAA